jgi:hypothetical protein
MNIVGSKKTTNTMRTDHNITKRTTRANTVKSVEVCRATTTLLGKYRGSPPTSNNYEDQTFTTTVRSISKGRIIGDTLRTLHG